MGVLERHLERYATMEAEVAACGGGVSAYILHPGTPGWAYAFIMTTAHGAACLCCHALPCGETTTIINLQAAEGATLTLPLPVCVACCDYEQVRAALDCICMDLFPYPVRLRMMMYKKEGKS
jgi:hypothetical protein